MIQTRDPCLSISDRALRDQCQDRWRRPGTPPPKRPRPAAATTAQQQPRRIGAPAAAAAGWVQGQKPCAKPGTEANSGAMNKGICMGMYNGHPAILKWISVSADAEKEIEWLRTIQRLCSGHGPDDGCRYVIRMYTVLHRRNEVGIVMELLGGGDLEAFGRRTGWWQHNMPRIHDQVCKGMRFIHAHSIIHCDIKAPNIMLRKGRDGLPSAVIVDFGLATPKGKPIRGGTPGYQPLLSSPGVVLATEGTDWFAWTLTVFELLQPGTVHRLTQGKTTIRDVDTVMHGQYGNISMVQTLSLVKIYSGKQ